MARAAIFDLDRTLISGASGAVFSDLMIRDKIVPPETRLVQDIAFSAFKVFGETLPAMALSRRGIRAVKGVARERFMSVAEQAAPKLLDQLEPYAVTEIERRREEGCLIVIATTTPKDLLEPFAALLGCDQLIATQYEFDEDGFYTGEVDGEFVWSNGKARSVDAWARANLVDLESSWAYSDSFFDVPLLESVGHPTAVNPDPQMLVYASSRKWPIRWFNAPEGIPKPLGIEPQSVVASLALPERWPWVDIQLKGIDNIPDTGGAILAANHRSYLDPLLVGYAAHISGLPIRFLAKSELTDSPFVGSLVRAMGAIRVERGSGTGESIGQAADALKVGELIGLFPQGTIPRGPAFFEAELKGRTGAVRMSRIANVPIVPIGLWGTELAWPRNSKVPYFLNLSDPPTVTLVAGEPYFPDPEQDDEVATAELMARIVALLPPEAQTDRVPTPEELAATYPAGSTAA